MLVERWVIFVSNLIFILYFLLFHKENMNVAIIKCLRVPKLGTLSRAAKRTQVPISLTTTKKSTIIFSNIQIYT